MMQSQSRCFQFKQSGEVEVEIREEIGQAYKREIKKERRIAFGDQKDFKGGVIKKTEARNKQYTRRYGYEHKKDDSYIKGSGRKYYKRGKFKRKIEF